MKKRLVIIDGKSVFYRGYYAMGRLATSEGVPTGGIYGFAAIAMELVKELAPTKVVVAWDKAGTSITKRKALFDGYKAGRVKPPEDFFAQIPYLRDLVAALGWAFVECDDYEADDIIGTLALQADEDCDERGVCRWDTFIISSDLDMLQIVDENTRMYRVMKGFTKLEELDVPAVEAKYGIRKRQFLDLKALKGDASDNIPGVPGIGEKTAVKLLGEFDSLAGIYERIDEVRPESLKAKLVAGKESAEMSYKLAKIMTDAPVKLVDLPDLVVDEGRIVGELKKLEFKTLINKFFHSIEGVLSEADASQKRPAFLGPSASATPTDYNDKTYEVPEILEWDVKAAMHADEKMAERVLAGEKFWDLGQGKFLLNPLKRKEPLTLLSLDEKEKGAEYQKQREEYAGKEKLYKVLTELDLPLIPVLYKMEKRGMKIDVAYFGELKKEYERKVAEISEEVYAVAGPFNINSAKQTADLLFERLGLPTRGIKRGVTGYSTGIKELEKLMYAHPVVPLIVKYREAAKLLSTYIEPLPSLADGNDRIHTTFTQDVTATGRLSSLNPNLQNIPTRTEEGKKIRAGFVAEEGKVLVSADYSQFELRLAAAIAGDEKLIADFNAGVDIHRKTAAEAFGVPMEQVTKQQRRAAKVINFGILYGMSVKGLADAAEMSFAEAKHFIERYFELRKPIKDKLEDILRRAREQGYVETLYGRRRPTPDVNSLVRPIKAAAERAAQNMPIQGTEADLMKKAMMAVDAALPEGAEMIMQVHDSLIIECVPELVTKVSAVLHEKMEGVAPELPVKLAVDVTSGQNWGEL